MEGYVLRFTGAKCNSLQRERIVKGIPLSLYSCTVFCTRSKKKNLQSTRKTGSSALSVLSHCVDPPRNQCRTALKDVSLKKTSLTHCVGVRCLTRPAPTAFSLLLSTPNAEEPKN